MNSTTSDSQTTSGRFPRCEGRATGCRGILTGSGVWKTFCWRGSAARVRSGPHADPRTDRAARAQERRGDRGEAVRDRGGAGEPALPAPELTASIVRAYTAAEEPPSLPWRVSMSGTVFRHEPNPRDHHLREFQQVGVELLGAGGPLADAEVIALADAALRDTGIADATVRVGHVGLILEMLDRSGLPPARASALVEMLSEAAAEGRNVRRSNRPWSSSTAGSTPATRPRTSCRLSARRTTRASIACSVTLFRTSPAAVPATRSSADSGASGTWATRWKVS